MSLKDKVIIVTGAHQGIGQATAVRLASEGATVVGADLLDCKETLGIIADAGGTVEAVQLDVRQSGSWAEVVAGVIDRHGRVDCLANVAGVVNMISEDSVVGLTEEAWDNVVGTDLKGVWLGMRAVIPTMIANGGGRTAHPDRLAGRGGAP
ncbi:SDR family NAD(P)-dependent oxidoreductase, partial [Gordonia sp. (in: high G+C Gram-positive bacteria)]|uniref:SDR family NAD(P)-dependent oxidoreductase n=1 Tax=Gordonia sp. (in: high G+C Gram-positive bacteria) TaxID=84139 RepID=UPI002CACEE96